MLSILMPNVTDKSYQTTPVIGRLKDIQPIRLELVSKTAAEPLWNHLVKRYHYLSYRKLLGYQLKYLALTRNRPVAALSWSAPALRLKNRDRYIGWSDEQRRLYLNRVVNNSRFLILPWIQIPNLASHVLSMNVQRLRKDWQKHFDIELFFLETFVDPERFKATSYKAANWLFVGLTRGYTKQGSTYIYHGSPKEIYVYEIESNFRQVIGCQKQNPIRFFSRSPESSKIAEVFAMLLPHCQWSADIEPLMDINEQDIEKIADELLKFHDQFLPCFGRKEHEGLSLSYLSGIMSKLPGKSVEPIALTFLGEKKVRSLQRFMKRYRWDHDAMNHINQTILAKKIAHPEGMINLDPSEFAKKGKESVGVARQYCGSLGKVDNCQSGIFVGYSSEKGYGLLDCQLYMPEIWFTEEYEKRREDNMVPADLTFQTKIDIGLNLINKIAESTLFPAKWIGVDATFGSDIHFLNSLPQGMNYFASIRSTTQVFLEKPKLEVPAYKGRGRLPEKLKVRPGEPQAIPVSKVLETGKLQLKPTILAEGAKGPIIAKVGRIRVYQSRGNLPENDPVWLFVRKTQDGEIKYALSNAPEDEPLSELCKASTMRWPIEQGFEDGKKHLGMDQYEHRSWPAWHRHMVYIFLAQTFLLGLRLALKKKHPC